MKLRLILRGIWCYLFPLQKTATEIIDEFLANTKTSYSSKLDYKHGDYEAREFIEWLDERIKEKRKFGKCYPKMIQLQWYDRSNYGRRKIHDDFKTFGNLREYLSTKFGIYLNIRYDAFPGFDLRGIRIYSKEKFEY